MHSVGRMPRLLALVVLFAVIALAVVAFSRDDGGSPLALQDSLPSAEAAPVAGDTTAPVAGGTAVPAAAATPQVAPEVVAPEAASEVTEEVAAADRPDIQNDGPNMGLRDIQQWLQTDVSSVADLDGKVRVLQFWTFGCFNCKNTIPNLQNLYAEHGSGEGDFEIIGVHAPEFDYEEDIPNVEAAAVDLGVTWPIAIDNTRTNFFSWQEGSSSYWPRTYVLDREGNIRFDHIGEGAYEELNDTVAALLADPTL